LLVGAGFFLTVAGFHHEWIKHRKTGFIDTVQVEERPPST
jgi:hypothetical protein